MAKGVDQIPPLAIEEVHLPVVVARDQLLVQQEQLGLEDEQPVWVLIP